MQVIKSLSRRAFMHCSCAMMSPKDTSPEEEGADADEAEWAEGAVKFDCRD